MKFLRFLPIAAIACVAVSCQNGSGNGLSGSASQTDSLMYYLGQMNAADYLREATRDTTLKEASEKQAYISGVRAGLAALKEGNDNYNKGVMLGMQMASQMMSFSEQMDVKINRSSYINSLSNALMADTMPNTTLAQTEFRTVMQNIENAKEEKDKASSRESLKKVAKSANLPEINEDLFGKVTASNDSVALQDGDEVNVVVNVTKEDGDPVRIPMSPRGKLGAKRSFPEVVSAAMLTMKNGETGEFMTTAHALLGARAMQMDLKPTDILKFTITPSLVAKDPEKDNN